MRRIRDRERRKNIAFTVMLLIIAFTLMPFGFFLCDNANAIGEATRDGAGLVFQLGILGFCAGFLALILAPLAASEI